VGERTAEGRKRLRVLFVEPYCGGSHERFARHVAARSRHRVELLTLPGSHWKWRMRGAHLSLLREVRRRAGEIDCLLASSMLSLAELCGTVPALAGVRKVVYCHESQFAYPVAPGEARDVHFGFTNLSTALAADALVFNSRFHLEEFVGGIGRFLKPMPDHRPTHLADELRPKCAVIHPGIDCDELDRHRPHGARGVGPPAVLWNHRWEYDKQPEVFFRVLGTLAREGIPFRAHVVGESFREQPPAFAAGRAALGDRVATFGHLPERAAYVRTLRDSAVVVSTAVQEYFGIAVMEAAYCGARPLLPRRLAYPELYPSDCLYDDEGELRDTLRRYLTGGVPPFEVSSDLRARYDVRECVRRLDDLLAAG
jgi:glycosyltransferase involved in cell wall biosynthesis